MIKYTLVCREKGQNNLFSDKIIGIRYASQTQIYDLSIRVCKTLGLDPEKNAVGKVRMVKTSRGHYENLVSVGNSEIHKITRSDDKLLKQIGILSIKYDYRGKSYAIINYIQRALRDNWTCFFMSESKGIIIPDKTGRDLTEIVRQGYMGNATRDLGDCNYVLVLKLDLKGIYKYVIAEYRGECVRTRTLKYEEIINFINGGNITDIGLRKVEEEIR